MDLTRKVKIETLADGAVSERLQLEMDEVIRNCLDINKKSDFVREVNLKIKVKPNPERTSAAVEIGTGSKLAPLEAMPAQFLFDQDAKEAHEVTARQGELPFDHGNGKITKLNK